MRIFHLTISFDPAAGGVPAVAASLASAQAALGHDVGLVGYNLAPGSPAILKLVNQTPGAEQLARIDLGPWSRSESLFPRTGPANLRPILRNADVLHIHGVWDPINRAAAIEARRSGVPYVIVPHGMLDPWSLSQQALKKRIALALSYRRILDRAAFLHVLNDFEARSLRDLRLRAPVEIIPNGLFEQDLLHLPAPGAFHRAHPALEGNPYILFLSRLHYKKGLDFLADAFREIAQHHPHVRLVVAGPDGGAREDFQRRIDDAGLQNRVYLPGLLFGDDKRAALVDATLFCLPSRQEGFSMAVTEALGASLPVVISDQCHFDEVAAAGAGIVLPLDAHAFAESTLNLLRDPDLRRRMGEAGRQLVSTRYTWPNIARQSIDAYHRHGVSA